MSPPPGFLVPDFTMPLDVERHFAALPSNAAIKGTIAESIVDTVKKQGKEPPPMKRLFPFKDYPAREILELKLKSAAILWPDVPVREQLHRLGRTVFPGFIATLPGRVMYGFFGSNVGAVLKLANRGFEATQNMGRVSTNATSAATVEMHFTNTFTFLSSYHYGIIEGTLSALHVNGDVSFRPISETEGIFSVSWTHPAVETTHG